MSRNPTTRPAQARYLRGLALVIGLGCAAWGCDSKDTGGGKLKAVKAEGDAVLLTMKGDIPYFTANVADDVPSIKQGDTAAREEALIRKAMQIALERGLSHDKYAGKDPFQVNLFVLYELDEYGKGKAGSSLNLATVEVPRSALDGLTPAGLTGLSGAELRKRVRNPTFNPGNLDRFA
jgi:hypothetical protein